MFENEPYFQWREVERRLLADLQQREEAAIMKRKKCNNCGRAYSVPAVGSTVRNRWSMMLGVVIGPGTLNAETTVSVAVITGVNKGDIRNWFIDNAQVVHGHFHIDTKED